MFPTLTFNGYEGPLGETSGVFSNVRGVSIDFEKESVTIFWTAEGMGPRVTTLYWGSLVLMIGAVTAALNSSVELKALKSKSESFNQNDFDSESDAPEYITKLKEIKTRFESDSIQ